MAMNPDLIDGIASAISNRDLVEFIRLLELRPEIWNSESKFFHESQNNVSLLRKLTTEGFGVGLQSYLNRCWRQISREDAWDALSWYIINGATTICTRVLLEAAVESKPAFISSGAIFFFANFSHLYDVSERVARMEGFSVSARMKVIFDGEELRVCELPLHEAIANHQLAIAEYFIVEKGAAVDSLSFGITPLIIACHLILPNAVVLLLRNGCDPNYPPEFRKRTDSILSKLTKDQRISRTYV